MDETKNESLGHSSSKRLTQSSYSSALSRLKDEGRINEVIRECLKSLNTYPDDIRLRRLLAECYLEAGLTDQAESELVKLSTMIGDLVSAFKLRAEIYIEQKRYEEAEGILKQYLTYCPEDQAAQELMNRVGISKEGVVTDEEKLPEMSEAAREGEDIISEIATPTLAEICYEQGQIDEAISTYEKVIENSPDDEASKQRLAEIKQLAAKAHTEQKPSIEDDIIERTKRVITVLEGWLARVQEVNRV